MAVGEGDRRDLPPRGGEHGARPLTDPAGGGSMGSGVPGSALDGGNGLFLALAQHDHEDDEDREQGEERDSPDEAHHYPGEEDGEDEEAAQTFVTLIYAAYR